MLLWLVSQKNTPSKTYTPVHKESDDQKAQSIFTTELSNVNILPPPSQTDIPEVSNFIINKIVFA